MSFLVQGEPFFLNHLDMRSVESITGESNQVMVYGPEECSRGDIESAIKKNFKTGKIKKLFDYSMADIESVRAFITLEGREIEKLNYLLDDYNYNNINLKRECKMAIVDLVLENFKRFKEGKLPIILLFCTDKDGNTDLQGNPQKFDPIKVANKSIDRITYSELRRCYKLCVELASSNHRELREIAYVANETIKFVNLRHFNGNFFLEKVSPCWECEGWEEARLKRKKIKLSRSKRKIENLDWRGELLKAVQFFEAKLVPVKTRTANEKIKDVCILL